MSKIATTLAIAATTASAFPSHKIDVQPSFNQWCQQFKQCDVLSETETNYRAQVYNDTVTYINAHNVQFAAGKATYDMGVNDYSAMTHDEFKQRFKLGKYAATKLYMPYSAMTQENVVILPKVARLAGMAGGVDWRTKGAVTPVRNEGLGGSDWAFAATGATEGRIQIATGTMPGGKNGLSAQQLVDCSQAGFGNGAYKYIIKNKGLDSEKDYPYKGVNNQKCNKKKAKRHVGSITSYKDVKANNAAQFAAAVAQGPVSTAIEADHPALQSYKSGVFSGKCGDQPDHAALAVGYTDDAWIIKNTWGKTWGENGYIQLSRSTNDTAGQCGVLIQPTYPIAAKNTTAGSSLDDILAEAEAEAAAGPYEKPAPGCGTNEIAVQIAGIKGNFCSPKCSTSSPCPAAPSGTAQAECAVTLDGSTNPSQCALVCAPSSASSCPTGMACQPIQGTGVCTYA